MPPVLQPFSLVKTDVFSKRLPLTKKLLLWGFTVTVIIKDMAGKMTLLVIGNVKKDMTFSQKTDKKCRFEQLSILPWCFFCVNDSSKMQPILP